MPTRIRALLSVVIFAACQAWPLASAAAQSLAGTWLVTVDGIADKQTRTLIITSEAGPAPSADLAAKYGLTAKAQTPVEAKLIQSRTPRQLVVITQASTTITADENTDGTFFGTFVTKSGKSYPVKIARFTEEQKAQLQSQQTAASRVTSPCVSFEGRWSGTWAQGGQGRAWLWVQTPKADCTARFAYVLEDREPRGWSTGQIQDGTLTFTCNRSTSGVCTFKQVGDELWVSYSGSMGQNSAVFNRVK